MMCPTKILIPHDGSSQSDKAVDYVSMLSQRMTLQVRLVRCYEPPAAIYSLPELGLYVDAFSDQRLEQLLEQELEKKKSALPGVSCQVSVERMSAAEGILDWAESVDLVVMSSHGRGALGRWLVGSVTTRVARACSKPVLVVPRQAGSPRLQTILVCLDGSSFAEAGLREGLNLASAFAAQVIVYRCVPVIYPGIGLEEHLKEAQEYLERIQAEHAGFITRAVLHQSDGRPGIVETAQEESADLIVLGRRGTGGLSRWIMGSVAEEVLHQAVCPVLVAH